MFGLVHLKASQNLQRRETPPQLQNLGCSHLAAAEADCTDHPDMPNFHPKKI